MSLALKPSHSAVKAYYETLHQFGQLYLRGEGKHEEGSGDAT
jgi:hypothetical protein